jgi:hypothetical protein
MRRRDSARDGDVRAGLAACDRQRRRRNDERQAARVVDDVVRDAAQDERGELALEPMTISEASSSSATSTIVSAIERATTSP